MIMMRSTTAQVSKTGKPPPPVPPRPNKTAVAEALAKTKRSSSENLFKSNGPIRTAPSPPSTTETSNNYSNNNVTKDSSVVITPKVLQLPTVENSCLRKCPVLNRSPSGCEEVKVCTRTIVFQSNNMKTNVDVCSQDQTRSDNKVHQKNVDEFENPQIVDEETREKCEDSNWNEMISDRNHVNTLIDEMFASVLEVSGECCETKNEYVNIARDGNSLEISSDKATVTINSEDENGNMNKTLLIVEPKSDANDGGDDDDDDGDQKKQVKFDDKMNHEFLISELESMKKEQDKISKRQRKPSREIYDDGRSKIRHSDWVEVSNGRKMHLSSCQITVQDVENDRQKQLDVDESVLSRLGAMSSLHGLPPLPKSLSGFTLLDNPTTPHTPNRVGSSSRRATPPSSAPPYHVCPPHLMIPNGSSDGTGVKSANLDTQLAVLRREMYSLRQLDLSLLSQLWSLNESIQDFRQILQEQEDRVLSPPSPSPTPSSADDGEAEEFYSPSPVRFRPAPPPPPLRRPSNSSSGTSSV